MRCRDVERWMITGQCEKIDEDRMSGVEHHISQCSRCARFYEALESIRADLKTMESPIPPELLLKETRKKCVEEMVHILTAEGIKAIRNRRVPIPKPLWIVLFSMIVITFILALPAFKNIPWDENLTTKTIVGVIIIVQNGVMLFFMPLVLRSHRGRVKHFRFNNTYSPV